MAGQKTGQCDWRRRDNKLEERLRRAEQQELEEQQQRQIQTEALRQMHLLWEGHILQQKQYNLKSELVLLLLLLLLLRHDFYISLYTTHTQCTHSVHTQCTRVAGVPK